MIITELKEQITELKADHERLVRENERLSELLRQIAFKMLRRKLLKNPPPAVDYWSDLFCSPKEWATWVEDIGELASSGVKERE